MRTTASRLGKGANRLFLLRVALPAHALEKLMDGYRNGDPELQALLNAFRVLAIQPEDEHSLAVWEHEGGK